MQERGGVWGFLPLKNLHNHPFIWNKQYIFRLQGTPESMLASISAFQAICALPLFRGTHTMQYASGQRWCENAICTHTIRSTLAAVHTMPCLFITAWHMAMKVIDFIEASPTPQHLTAPSPSPLNSSASPHSSIPLPGHCSFVSCKIFFSLCVKEMAWCYCKWWAVDRIHW